MDNKCCKMKYITLKGGIYLTVNRIGETNVNSNGSSMEIVAYKKVSNITVKFLEYGNFVHTTYGNFKTGIVKNPYDKTVSGIGYLGEGNYKVTEKGKVTEQYWSWREMIRRCNDDKVHNRQPAYKGCKVDERWHNFQVFCKWFDENYYTVEGQRMSLDKDILHKSNKIYSPENCVFVPQRINNLFLKRDAGRGDFPIGVQYDNNNINKYSATCAIGKGNSKHLGTFKTQEEAFQAYKTFKENYIKEVANEYKNKIPDRLYNALMNYIVEITD
jgi:hypothetical protein